MMRAAFGTAPASPAPNRNRINTKSASVLKTSGSEPSAPTYVNSHMQLVSMVNADHHRTMRVSTPRAPN